MSIALSPAFITQYLLPSTSNFPSHKVIQEIRVSILITGLR